MSKNIPLYEKFGYSLPDNYGEITQICDNTYVCGSDKKWHMKSSYNGDLGLGCQNKNILQQMCKTSLQ